MTEKNNKKIIILAIMLLIITGCIFYLSSQDAETSTGVSFPVGETVGRILHADFDTWNAEAQQEYVISVDDSVRKCGHFGEFAVVGFLLAEILLTLMRRRALLVSILAVSLFALTDEVHQFFVPGRAFQLSDLAVDVTAVIVGAGVAWMLQRRRSRVAVADSLNF